MDCIFTNQKIIIMEIGRIIELTAMASFITIKELYTKGNGKKIISKELVKNIGLMELIFEDIFQKGRKFQGNSNGLIKVIMKVNL